MGNLMYILGAAIVLAIFYFFLKQQSKRQEEIKAEEHDARSHVVNDSNYNINREGIDGHRDSGLSKKEAEQTVRDFKQGVDRDMPSQEEFNEIRKDLD